MTKALSPFISTALIILMGMVTITLVLTVLNPALDKAKDSAVINEAFQNLELMDSNIREVASEGEDSKRTISLKVSEGTYRVDSTNDYLNFTYSMKTDFSISGQRGNINITRSGKDITLFIPYTKIDLGQSDHFTKGDNSVIISCNETNQSTNYPKIYLLK